MKILRFILISLLLLAIRHCSAQYGSGNGNYGTIGNNNTGNAATATTATSAKQNPIMQRWDYLTLANQLGFNTNHLLDGIWPSSGSVQIGGTNLSCAAGVFQPYMTNWWVMVSHAGGLNSLTVNTNYPFGSNTRTINNWFDAIGMVTNVLNSQNVQVNTPFGITTNGVFILAPSNNAPFQACVNYCSTNYGNNELDIPDGIIALTYPWLSTGPWTNNPTCLISLPHISQFLPEKTVRIVGNSDGNLVTGASVNRSMPGGINGTIIVPMVYGSNANLFACIDTRDLTGPSVSLETFIVFPAPYQGAATSALYQQPYNSVNFQMENIGFQVPFDHNFAVINGFGMNKHNFKSINIADDMVASSSEAVGGTNGWGILFPGGNNDNEQYSDGVAIQNCYNAISIGGNNVFNNLWIQYSWNGIVGECGANPDVFHGILNMQGVKNHVVAWGTTDVAIDHDAPQDTGPVWMSWPNLAIANNSSFLLGSINYVSEALLTYTVPLPTSPALGTGGLQYLTVYGNNGTQGGGPQPSFIFNPPKALSQQVFSNGFDVASGQIVEQQYSGYPQRITSGQQGSDGVDWRFEANSAASGDLIWQGAFGSPVNAFQWVPTALGVYGFSANQDGQFLVESNVTSTAMVMQNTNGFLAFPINGNASPYTVPVNKITNGQPLNTGFYFWSNAVPCILIYTNATPVIIEQGNSVGGIL